MDRREFMKSKILALGIGGAAAGSISTNVLADTKDHQGIKSGPPTSSVDVTLPPYNVPNDGRPASKAIQQAINNSNVLFFP